MAERMIRFRLFHYYEEVDALGLPGVKVLSEKHASFGESVDLRKEDVARGDAMGALFTEDEVKHIKAGTYTGPEAALLGQAPMVPPLTPAEAEAQRTAMPQGEGSEEAPPLNMATADADEIAEYIAVNRLNVDLTVDLANGDADWAEKVLDAENLATENEPRKGVVEGLEAIPTVPAPGGDGN